MHLVLQDIKKEYTIGKEGRFPALRGVSLNFESGELVSVIGESGSGKSTLMNLIGGLDRSYQGSILLEGRDLHSYQEKELDRYRKDRIGFVFQSFNLIPHLSVLDNIAVALTLSGISKKERLEKARQALLSVGLGDQMTKKPNQLSGGQKQRVAIARALVNDPDIILADEPTGSLDSETSQQILEILKGIAQGGKLVLMVTHSDLVAAISSRIVRLKDGLVVEDTGKGPEESDPSTGMEEQRGKQTLSFFAAVAMAMKNMKEKIGRNILVALGASIGITSVVVMLSIGNGVERYITSTMNQYVNPLVVEVSQRVTEDNKAPEEPGALFGAETLPFTQEQVGELEKLSGVEKVEKAFSQFSARDTTVMVEGGDKVAFQILGTVSSKLTAENVTQGAFPKEGEILLSAELAGKLGTDLVGSKVQLNLIIDKVAYEEDFIVSGIYGEISDNGMQSFNTVYMDYGDLSALVEAKDKELEVNTLYLVAKDTDGVDGIKEKVADLGYEGSMEDQLLSLFSEMLAVITYILSAIAAISLVVSAIMILVVLYISVVERTREIGVLKAIGARRKDIRRIFVAEAFVIGFASGSMGILSSGLLMVLINNLTQKLYEVDLVVISLPFVLFGLGVSILISMLAGLAPAGMAARLDPVESLRRE